jgi:DNA-binding response OmpR family regulator
MSESSSDAAELKLSPTASYYIRRLLHQNLDCLKSVLAEGAGVKANPLSDLNQVVSSLYLEQEEIAEVMDQLERLSSRHQMLATQGGLHRQEMDKTQTEIFWLLGFRAEERPNRGLLLLVDDQPENLRVLSMTLDKQGYDIRSTVSGKMAITAAKTAQPDLILLDIMMPEMDGYEVCRQLKSQVETSDIPIIFVSAIDDTLDKVKAFQVGGSDYITKPFRIEEVSARIENQLQIRQLQVRLRDQNIRLEKELQRVRSQQSQNELLQLAINQIGDYVLFCDDQAQIIEGNEAACRWLGYSYDNLPTLSLFTITEQFTMEDWKDQRDRLRQWGFLTLQAQHCTQSGDRIPVSLSMYYFTHQEQERFCVVARERFTPESH